MSSSLLSRVLAGPTIVAAIASFSTLAAMAHAVIVDSTPAVDATVDSGTFGVTLRYNSRIDHKRSRLSLLAADGKSRPLAVVMDGPPDVVAAQVQDLPPGKYRLHWQVLAVDGHLTRGDIPFSVKAP